MSPFRQFASQITESFFGIHIDVITVIIAVVGISLVVVVIGVILGFVDDYVSSSCEKEMYSLNSQYQYWKTRDKVKADLLKIRYNRILRRVASRDI